MPRGTRELVDDLVRLRNQAVVEHNLGHPAAALRTLRRAAAKLDHAGDDPALRAAGAAVWISLALNEAEVHGAAAGLVAFARAQQQCDGLDDPGLLFRLHMQYGYFATRVGQIDLAEEQFALAFELEDSADPHDHFGLLLNCGNLRMYQGRIAEAYDLIRRASDVARAAGDEVNLFKSLHNLGYLAFLQGRLVEALDTMERTTEMAPDFGVGIVSLDRARVLLEAGLVREADEALVRAAEEFAAERLGQDLGEVEVARAEAALLAGDPSAARRFAGSARDRFRRRGNDQWRRTAELVLVQADLADGRPGLRLAGPALRLEAELRRDGLPVRATTAALTAAEALLSAGRAQEAAGVLTRLGQPAGSDPLTVRLHFAYVQARLDVAGRNEAAANRQIRSGLRQLSKYQASFGGIEMRTASAVHGARLAELDQALALRDGSPAAVFAAMERSRAVSARLPSVQPPTDELSAELLTELRQVVESIRAARENAGGLQKRRHELERQIAARSWTLPGAGAAPRPVSLADARAALDDDRSTMVAYLRSADGLHAMVLSANRARIVDLGDPATVEEQIRRVRADFDVLASDLLQPVLRTAAEGSLRRGLGELNAMLLRPLQLGDDPLVVVPMGILGAVPWNALASCHARPVVVAPSASSWYAGRLAARTATKHAGTVALAGPMLARAGDEVSQVSTIARSTTVAPAATRAALVDALGSARIVHVAAHGQHNTENPLFSSVQLDDGELFAHELTHSAPHVVLSACELGAATVRPGDEALGLTGVLLRIGTASVVSSVSRVADAAAAEAMVDYHRALADGLSSSEALAAALAGHAEPLPFVCFGAPWRATA